MQDHAPVRGKPGRTLIGDFKNDVRHSLATARNEAGNPQFPARRRSHKWPGSRTDYLAAAGLLVTFILTVILTNRITRDLRAHRRRLLRQNRRITKMTDQLRRQQQALVQHEKMIAMG